MRELENEENPCNEPIEKTEKEKTKKKSYITEIILLLIILILLCLNFKACQNKTICEPCLEVVTEK